MTLYHIDFIPRLLQAEVPFSTLSLTGSLPGPRYETFSTVIQHMNEWLASHTTTKVMHVEVLEVDGFYGINIPEKTSGKNDRNTCSAFLKIIRLWYTRSTSELYCTSQVSYIHILPARLESTPRSFSPKFQSLEAMINVFNEKIYLHGITINGSLVSFQTGMFRFTAQNCSLDPERMFWMVDSNPEDLHVCFYFTLFFCPLDHMQCVHQIGFKDFAPTLTLKGQKIEGEDIKKVLEKFQKWQSDDHQTKVINVQTVDHHAYYRCARDSSGYELNSLSNPHFRSSFRGMMQYVKVMRLFYCTCHTCCNKDKTIESSNKLSVIGQKAFHIERFIPLSQINFSKFPLQLPSSLHTEYLSRISNWILSSGVKVISVETSKLCLADPRSSTSAENVIFQSSVKSKASAVYAIRLYVQPSMPFSSLSCIDLKPEPRITHIQPRSCVIL